MKRIGMLIVLLLVFGTTGCALLVPPPYVNSETKVIKNKKGEVVGSEYTRKVRGFTYGDKETAESWALADSIAQQSSNQSYPRLSAPSTTNSERECPYWQRGVIANEDRYYTYVISIVNKHLSSFSVGFIIRPGQTIEHCLPAGEYRATSKSAYEEKKTEFLVRPGKQVYFNERSYGWTLIKLER